MKKIFFLLTIIFFAFYANASNDNTNKTSATPPLKHFMWGVDFGSSIDMSGNDMSSLDIDAYFGYKNKIFRALGIGASIHSALGNDFAFMPVYFIMRTSFTSRPTLCFLDLRAGYSFNTLTQNESQSNPFASLGLGFNLYSNNKFKSHIIMAYGFQKIDEYTINDQTIKFHNLNTVSIRIGISF